MAYVFLIFMAILIFEFGVYLYFDVGRNKSVGDVKMETKPSADTSQPVQNDMADDIIGKSSFTMKTETERMRQRQEEAARKAAIARGEMTEDGKEIAKPVNPEDCEFEQKKVWKQVSSEEIKEMFDEPDEPEEPHASGQTIDDIDLAFKTARNPNPTKEEVRKAAEAFQMLDGTELKDEIYRILPEVGKDIDRVMKLFSDELSGKVSGTSGKESTASTRKKPKSADIPDRFEDFSIQDLF